MPAFTIDGVKPTVSKLKNRLREFWLPDESILYIGKAPKRNINDGIGNRVNEYYRTIIGNRSPHSGGQWLKTLANLNSMTVFYGHVENSGDKEIGMFDYFIRNVSPSSLKNVKDKQYPLPFANLRYKLRIDKNSGMDNQRVSRLS